MASTFAAAVMVMAGRGRVLLFRHPRGRLDTVRGLPSGGCGDLRTQREFPSDKVYRRDDCGIVGVESFGLQCLAFVVIHTVLAGCAEQSPRHSSDGRRRPPHLRQLAASSVVI
jgi:hypothetical protein